MLNENICVGNESELSANMKRTVLTSVDEAIETMDHDWIEIDSDTEKIYFAGELIWSEEENGKEEIPKYVNELVRLHGSLESYSIGMEDENITIDYDAQGKYITWDFGGNVVREGYYKDAPSKYFEGTVLGMKDDYMIIQPFGKYWITDVSNKIYVSMNTEEGQMTKDFKNVTVGDPVGVHFSGDLPEEPDYVIDRVTNIETNLNN